jgi:hypothetical protein
VASSRVDDFFGSRFGARSGLAATRGENVLVVDGEQRSMAGPGGAAVDMDATRTMLGVCGDADANVGDAPTDNASGDGGVSSFATPSTTPRRDPIIGVS